MPIAVAIHPISQERVEVQIYDALQDDLDKFEAAWCSHADKGVRSTEIKGNSIAYYEVCLQCGVKLGSALRQKEFPDPPPFMKCDEIERTYVQKRKIERFVLIERHAKLAAELRRDWVKKWGAYLRSDEWRKKRDLVLKRADCVCEGCGVEKATEVHHLTYERRFTEMLFDLVALCATCHSLIHFEKNEKLRSVPFSPMPDRCQSCRYQSTQDDRPWCGVFDVPASASLESQTLCNNGKNGFEGLR